MTDNIVAFGIGVRRKRGDAILDVLFPEPFFKPDQSEGDTYLKGIEYSEGVTTLSDQQIDQLFENFRLKTDSLNHALLSSPCIDESTSYFSVDLVLYVLYDLNSDVTSVEEAYFKLQLLSQRWVEPHGVNLGGIFGILHNIAWTNKGPILAEDLDQERISYQLSSSPLLLMNVLPI